MTNLEREAIMLRKQIKEAKYANEKNSYQEFAKRLTVLRSDRGRSSLTRSQNEKSVSAERRKSPIDFRSSYTYQKAAP